MKRAILIAAMLPLTLLTPEGYGQSRVARPKPIKAKFCPPKGRCLVFIDGSRGGEEIASYREVTRTEPSGSVVWVMGVFDDKGYFRHQAGEESRVLLVNLALHRPGSKTEVFFDEILAGKLDDQIDKMGRLFRDSGHPIFANIRYEFDYHKTYTPDQYAKVYRYIHDRWDRVGATNVAYVWHSVGDNRVGPEMMKFYPGDKYVDWWGISFYHPGNSKYAARFAANARQRGKPLIICESSPLPGMGNDWKSFFRPYFQFIYSQDVRAIMYFNSSDKNAGFGGGRLDRLPPSIREGWTREIGKPYFLKGNDNLYQVLGYDGRTQP